MASVTLNESERWAPGLTIGAYLRSNWATWQLPPAGAAVGATAATAVVSGTGTVAFTGLADNTAYYAARSTGADGYVRFSTPQPAASGGVSSVAGASDVASGPFYDATVPAWEASSSSFKPSLNDVVADPRVPDGSSNNTAYLTTLMNRAIALGVSLRIPAGTSNPWLIRELTLVSNAKIDARGATFRLYAGLAKRMVINNALTLGTVGVTRDSNISWRGGKFDRQAIDGRLTGLDGMQLMFGFIDGLQLYDIENAQTSATSNGAFGLYLCFCDQVILDGWTSNSTYVNAGTVQVLAGNNIVIRNVNAPSAGDDIVALVPGNGSSFTIPNYAGGYEGGNITNVIVENVVGGAGVTRNGVKILGGNSVDGASIWTVRNIAVRNVSGAFPIAGASCAAIWLGGDTNYTTLDRGVVENVTFEHIYNTKNNGLIVSVKAGAKLRGINFRDINAYSVSASTNTVVFAASCTVEDMVIADSHFDIGSGRYLASIVGGTIGSLKFRNIKLTGPTSGSPNGGPIVIAASQTVDKLTFEDITTTGQVWCLGANNGTINALHVRGLRADGAERGLISAPAGSVTTFREGAMSGLNEPDAPSAVLNDTCTGALGALTSHTPDTGTSWVSGGAATTANQLSGNGDVYRASSPNGLFWLSDTPARPDYQVDCTISALTLLASDSIVVAGRITDNLNYYQAFLTQAGALQLYKVVANASSQLGSTATVTLTAGTFPVVSLVMQGTTISVLYNNVTQISVTDATFAPAGKAGIKVGGGSTTAQTTTTGLHVDRLTVSLLSPVNAAIAGTVYSYASAAKLDVAKVTKTQNAEAWNTNVALTCGAGPVISDGTNWKHKYTGATA